MSAVDNHRPAVFLVICALVFLIQWPMNECCSGIGPCPKREGMPNLNLTKFAGHWYEIERSFYLMELVRSCITVDITELPHGKLGVVIKAKSTWTGSFSFSEGVATPTRRDPSIVNYKVNSKLPKAFNKYVPRLVNYYLPGSGYYQVLRTDYGNYAIIYSCNDYGIAHTDLIWIWGRRKELNAEMRSDIYGLLAEYRLDSERLTLSKNANCTDDDD
nr:unnamed protein product [Callosobruchus analis]